MDLHEKLLSFDRKYKEGLTRDEIETILDAFKVKDRDKFFSSLGTTTCIKRGDELVVYLYDVELALNRTLQK